MTEEGRKYSSDIRSAIEAIGSFIKDTPDFSSYEKDLKTQSAVERQLGIIGEALNKLKKSDPGTEIRSQEKIIAFRNRLVHGYDRIDNAIVWAILQRHLPQLKEEIEQLEKGDG